MIANFHTHSYHCRHAAGKPEEYVLTAIRNGLAELGFSDHVPYPFSNGHRSGFRMDVSETETYVREILGLREKYAGQITIWIGYEAEYYPAEFRAMLENICRFPVDYLICGQHFSNNEYDGEYNGAGTDDPAKLRAYVDQLTEAMSTGAFTYIAHPDIFRFSGPDDIYAEETLRLCEASQKYGVPLEYNCLGLEGKRHYPNELFWKTAAGSGASFVVGSDAHQPEKVGNPEITAQAEGNLRELGIVPLARPELRKPVL